MTMSKKTFLLLNVNVKIVTFEQNITVDLKRNGRQFKNSSVNDYDLFIFV